MCVCASLETSLCPDSLTARWPGDSLLIVKISLRFEKQRAARCGHVFAAVYIRLRMRGGGPIGRAGENRAFPLNHQTRELRTAHARMNQSNEPRASPCGEYMRRFAALCACSSTRLHLFMGFAVDGGATRSACVSGLALTGGGVGGGGGRSCKTSPYLSRIGSLTILPSES